MQFEFAWPWLLLSVLLPVLSYWLIKPAERASSQAALYFPNAAGLSLPGRSQTDSAPKLFKWLALLAWMLLVAAAARPQWVGQTIQLPVSGRAMMLAVDISGSMGNEDMLINNQAVPRLTAVKVVAGEFISQRQGDYLGLILFGRNAYLQSPLSHDLSTVKALLGEAVVGIAGKETAMGDAIGLAIKRLRKQPAENRILILLTDGANTAGIDPMKTADLAAQENIKIYTIGVGGDGRRIRGLFGLQISSSDLDERSLQIIADKTGGRYFRARDLHELTQIYALLDEIEPVADKSLQFRPVKELYQWPLAAALLLAMMLATWRRLYV